MKSTRLGLGLELAVLMFLACAMLLWQCQCRATVDPPPGTPPPVWDWVLGPAQVVRCYPVHVHAQGESSDHSDLATYEWKQFTDHQEYQNQLDEWLEPNGWDTYCATGFPLNDEVGHDFTLPSTFWSEYAYWSGSGQAPYTWFIDFFTHEAEVLWDFTPVPANAQIISSELHTQISGTDQIGTGAYYAYPTTLAGISLGTVPLDETTEVTVDAGTDWVPGAEAWLRLESPGSADTMGATNLPSETPSNTGRRDCSIKVDLGWGHFSEGDCAYIEITYRVPTWECVENCP